MLQSHPHQVLWMILVSLAFFNRDSALFGFEDWPLQQRLWVKRDESLSAWHSFSSDRSLAVCWVMLDWTFSKLLPSRYENLVRRCCRSQTACVLTHWVVILKAQHFISASIKCNCKINDGLPKTAIVWTKRWFCSKLTPVVEPEHVRPFKQTQCK